MADPKVGISNNGETMHYSVGALIKKNEKYLLIDRAKPPFGFAGVAGHIDKGENEVQALIREVGEESGLIVKTHRLLFEEEVENPCRRGINVHYWYLFECNVSGKVKRNYTETKEIGWYSRNQISKLQLEPVWSYWFKKLNII